MSKKKCYVAGCCSMDESRFFKFPNPMIETDRFLQWLAASGNRELLNVSPANIKHRSLCSTHFETKYILSKKLSNTAIPTLNLPEKIKVLAYEEIIKENTTPGQCLKAGTLKTQRKLLQGSGTPLIVTFKRREIFLNMQMHLARDFQKRIEYLERDLSEKSKCGIVIDLETKRNLLRLFSIMRTKWKESGRKMTNFLEKNQEWLNVDVPFTADSKPNQASLRDSLSLGSVVSSERLKERIKTEELSESHVPEELCPSVEMSLRTVGDLDSIKTENNSDCFSEVLQNHKKMRIKSEW